MHTHDEVEMQGRGVTTAPHSTWVTDDAAKGHPLTWSGLCQARVLLAYPVARGSWVPYEWQPRLDNA